MILDRLTIHFAALCMACCYGILSWASQSDYGVDLSLFYPCIAVAALCYLWLLHQETTQTTWLTVLGWAVIFRIIGFTGTPLLEDDFYRYLWDGYQLMTQGNPYLKPPEDFFNDPAIPLEFQTILGNINNPETPTVYGPGLQFLFGLSNWIKPAALWPLKTLLIGCDLLLIGLLMRIGSLKNVLLYAWNPLVIKEIAFTAHIDGLIPLLLIAAWLCKQHGRLYWMAVFLGFATTVKVPAVLLAPFYLWRSGYKPIVYFITTVFLCYWPFISKGSSDVYALFRFAQDWQFNSALYGLLNTVVSGSLSRYMLGLLVVIWVFWLWRNHQQTTPSALPRGDLIFAGLILASPAINPWYWLWVLPFSVIYPSRWVWIASLALLLSYITGLNLESETLQAYQQPLWVPWIEFSIIAVAIYLEYRNPDKAENFCVKRRAQE